ncbi:CUB domain-containing protein 1 [Bombina bombina]|uniref:CUB domain-containing protein 1 n=1 Tax=Bombina bombina TaxID=8345 RepID=UPI00235A6041|nr:CUB domain-containing protein 1 [Bombina bombina]
MSANCGLYLRVSEMLLIGLLFTWLIPQNTEAVDISLGPKDNITIIVKQNAKSPSSSCFMCVKNDCKRTTLTVTDGMSVSYSFTCPTPEKYYIMEIQKRIDCISGTCPFGKVNLQPSSFPGLNRTFSWNITTTKNIGLELSFSSPGLKQIESSYNCPDLVTFHISTSVDTSSVSIGIFCRNGTVSRIKVQGGGVVALHVPWNENVTESGLSIANRTAIKRLCIIESTFSRETSVILSSANYPLGFPDDEIMTWQFVMPPNHRASIKFLNYSLPNCVKKDERVEYYLPFFYSSAEVLKLTDRQPANIANDFNMTLANCALDNTNPGALSLLFEVVVQPITSLESILYNVDLTKNFDFNVHIRKKRVVGRQYAPLCLVCRTPIECEPELSLPGGKFYKISFLCNDMESFIVTAEKDIACEHLRTSQIKNISITVPPTLLILPVRLETVTWNIIAANNISAEIRSTSLNLQQDVSENPCDTNGSGFYYDIISSNAKNTFSLGTFCPNGSIEIIQLRDNVKIVLKVQKNVNFSIPKLDLHVSIIPPIEEECIFTVTPKADTTVYLRTPNWDSGVPDYVTVSWNIGIPEKQFANFSFAKNKMDITCQMGRAFANIEEKKAKGLDITRRDDELLPGPSQLYSPFWVNISNCKPRSNHKLQLQFSLKFIQVNSDLTIIVVAACVAAVSIVLIIGVTICCVKKKKKEKHPAVGIYNTKVPTEMTSRHGFFRKGRKKNESHVYAVIDDTMIYGHLLKDNNGCPSPNVDVYQPFEGPMGDAPPVPPINFPNGSTKDETREDPLALSMRENELYTINEPITKEPVENEDTSLSFVDEPGNKTVPAT